MGRKPVRDEAQKNVLMRSRRRCCLCFWLDGKDEMQKGQIAHLDQDNTNAVEDNLVFLCLDHHDEYDGTTSVTKGLREDEVRQWRDELYKEMEFRFRTVKRKSCSLSMAGFKWRGPNDEFCGVLAVKNTGEVGLTRITVSVRLSAGIEGEIPPREQNIGGGYQLRMPAMADPFAAYESRQDLFQPDGRVCIKELHSAMLMPGHSIRFEALLFHHGLLKAGALELDYRIDADDMLTSSGKLKFDIPRNAEDIPLDSEHL